MMVFRELLIILECRLNELMQAIAMVKIASIFFDDHCFVLLFIHHVAPLPPFPRSRSIYPCENENRLPLPVPVPEEREKVVSDGGLIDARIN
jgi:hypothetical protein